MALVRAADDEQDAAIFLTAAFTGLRHGELVALRWRDVDFARSAHPRRAPATPSGDLDDAEVRQGPLGPDGARGRRDARAPQPPRVWTGDDDLVFPGITGGYLDGSALSGATSAALERGRPPRLRFHDLRHTFGTQVIGDADVDPRSRSGWATPTSTTTMQLPPLRPARRGRRSLVADAFATSVQPSLTAVSSATSTPRP